MKKILISFLLLISLSLSSANAWFFDDLNDKTEPKSPYCQDDDCSLEQWIKIVKSGINDIEKEQKASEYAQSIVSYLLGFITIIAVVYIIYAWFQVLTAAWDEEKVKKTKNIIVYVIIWIIIIWLASPIVAWLIDLLNAS